MELVLTGRLFDAEEAERWGVASRIVRTEKAEGDEHLPVVAEALDMASKIAGFGQLATQAGKEAVNAGENRIISFISSLLPDIAISTRPPSIRRSKAGTSLVPQPVRHKRSEGR